MGNYFLAMEMDDSDLETIPTTFFENSYKKVNT